MAENDEPFKKFTERAQRVLTRAQKEAQRFNHDYIGTEHLLLGLVREGSGVAATVLSNLGVELSKVRSAVEFVIGPGDPAGLGEIGLTPRSKKVIELAVDEAQRLGHSYVGTEHLLIGMLRDGEGIAASVLDSLDVSLERARAETMRVLAGPSPEVEAELAAASQQLPAEQPSTRPVAARFATEAHRDTPASLAQDSLGFAPYARAMELMVRHTEPPLTVGILAPWGTGKSSMMTMIKELLEGDRRKDDQDGPNILTVWFNAWEHKDAEKIWSVLVCEILARLESEAGVLGRIQFILQRRWAGWWLMFKSRLIPLTAVLFAVAGGLAFSFLFRDSNPSASEAATAAGSAGVGGLFLIWDIFAAARSPASRQVYRFFSDIDLAERPGYLSELERDVDFLSEFIWRRADESRQAKKFLFFRRRQLRHLRVVVFIDDLDRCPPDKAVDVLEAVKLVLERKIFVTFLGVDARVLSRAVEQRYANVLPETTHPAGPGMEYLEKIIQLPFWVPHGNIDRYAQVLVRSQTSTGDASPLGEALIKALGEAAEEPGESVMTYAPMAVTADPSRVSLTEQDRELFRQYSRFLPRTPRGVKRIVNLYRFARGLGATEEQGDGVLRWIIVADRWQDFADFVSSEVAWSRNTGASDWTALLDTFETEVTRSGAWTAGSGRYRRHRREELDLLRELFSTPEIRPPEELREVARYIANLAPVPSRPGLQPLRPEDSTTTAAESPS